MNTVPVWIVWTIYPGGLNNIVTVCVCDNSQTGLDLILLYHRSHWLFFSSSSLLSLETLNTFESHPHCVCIWPTNEDCVISNASGCHGVLTLQLGSSFPPLRTISFSRERKREREKVQSGEPLSSSHLQTLWRRKGREGERKAALDHKSSWLSNSKLKRGAISWGPISRKLVLSVGVTPLGGGERWWGLLLREIEREREGKLCTDCHITVCELEILWDGWQAKIDCSDNRMSQIRQM